MRLGHRLPGEFRNPGVILGGAQMQHARQRGDQRVERLQVATEKAADDGRIGTALDRGRRAHRVLAVERKAQRQPVNFRAGEPAQVGVAAHSRRTGHDVGIPVRKHHHVPGEQFTGGSPGMPAQQLPWATAWYSITCSTPRISSGAISCRRRLGGPLAAARDIEEHGAAQTHAAQDIRQRVLAHVTVAAAFRSSRADDRSTSLTAQSQSQTREQAPTTRGQAAGRPIRKNQSTRRDRIVGFFSCLAGAHVQSLPPYAGQGCPASPNEPELRIGACATSQGSAMSAVDARGYSISGATPTALEAYERALATFQSWRTGTHVELSPALREAPTL